jgi:TPR repeat protein
MALGDTANNICQSLGRGVTRSKRRAIQWTRKAAENGLPQSCLDLAAAMYGDISYAREVGHVEDAVEIATSIGDMEVFHDVPPDVLASVLHWLEKGGHNTNVLDGFRTSVLEGYKYCRNEGCEVVGPLKEFKVCPQCKTARYCGAACQKQDWTTGGHKAKCGTFYTAS